MHRKFAVSGTEEPYSDEIGRYAKSMWEKVYGYMSSLISAGKAQSYEQASEIIHKLDPQQIKNIVGEEMQQAAQKQIINEVGQMIILYVMKEFQNDEISERMTKDELYVWKLIFSDVPEVLGTVKFVESVITKKPETPAQPETTGMPTSDAPNKKEVILEAFKNSVYQISQAVGTGRLTQEDAEKYMDETANRVKQSGCAQEAMDFIAGDIYKMFSQQKVPQDIVEGVIERWGEKLGVAPSIPAPWWEPEFTSSGQQSDMSNQWLDEYNAGKITKEQLKNRMEQLKASDKSQKISLASILTVYDALANDCE